MARKKETTKPVKRGRVSTASAAQVKTAKFATRVFRITVPEADRALRQAISSGASQATVNIRADDLAAAVKRQKRKATVRNVVVARKRRAAGKKQGRGR